MKKAVRSSTGVATTIQAAPAAATTASSAKQPASRPQAASPTPVWTRYVDSRLKQFCLR
jgi:hypothetical protein